MTGLLIHDICNEHACSQPGVPLDNPLDLFADGAVHGGMWRTPYSLRSYIEMTVLYHYLAEYQGVATGAAAVGAGMVALLARRFLVAKKARL